MPLPKSIQLTEEHQKQWLMTVLPILIPLLIFLGIVWGDHSQTARNTADIASLTATKNDHEHRITVLEDEERTGSQTTQTLGSEIGDLHLSVNQLTLAVQKLTDLLPEHRR